jgi:copper resistance protein B
MRRGSLLIGLAAILLLWPAGASGQLIDDKIYTFVLFELAEYRWDGNENPVAWDMVGWIGGDYTRFWFKSEGAAATVESNGDIEVQALYGRLIAPYWDLQAGLRADVVYGGGEERVRVQAVIGLQGLAPYWVEFEPAVYVSQDGDVSAGLTASYNMFVTQRLVGQPRVEVNAALQEVPDFGVGSGFNDLELGFRLRYELRREYAPYVGVNWVQQFAGTADLARQAGEAVSDVSLVGGIRVWF